MTYTEQLLNSSSFADSIRSSPPVWQFFAIHHLIVSLFSHLLLLILCVLVFQRRISAVQTRAKMAERARKGIVNMNARVRLVSRDLLAKVNDPTFRPTNGQK